MDKFIIDTSVVIERAITKLLKDKKISGEILIPKAVIAELEHQANSGKQTGIIGLEELQDLQNLKEAGKIDLAIIGTRPNLYQIHNAKQGGEIDALIHDLAYDNSAILITADKIQANAAKASGIQVEFITLKPSKEFKLASYFDNTTMSLHLKANVPPLAKKGKPGEWQLVEVDKKPLSSTEVEDIAKQVIELSRIDPEAFIEISRESSTVVQYQNYRIVIVKPPVADGWEITAVKPLKQLSLEEYNLQEELMARIKKQARGIIVAGETGSGKSTFSSALAVVYSKSGRIVKTVESPRDLVLPDNITQYSKSFTSSEEIHDILLLSRPDYIIFDEVRDTPDFKLFTDLRLSGSNCLGVLHAATPIDAVNRFIERLDVGLIPSVLDTIIFIDKGDISKVLTVRMTVKVPSGMTESDLGRPVVEVSDFFSGKCEFEIYSYGEQTVVIPVSQTKKVSSTINLATQQIETVMSRYVDKVRVEIIDDNKAVVYVPERDIPRVIGKQGVTVDKIEKELGIRIDVQELKKESDGYNTTFDIQERGANITIFVRPNAQLDIFVNDQFLFTAASSKRGEIRINKKSKLGYALLEALTEKKKIELRTA
ncbi:MAG: PINc/VapC family ATPase [Nanoarchaeota archaeon]